MGLIIVTEDTTLYLKWIHAPQKGRPYQSIRRGVVFVTKNAGLETHNLILMTWTSFVIRHAKAAVTAKCMCVIPTGKHFLMIIKRTSSKLVVSCFPVSFIVNNTSQCLPFSCQLVEKCNHAEKKNFSTRNSCPRMNEGYKEPRTALTHKKKSQEIDEKPIVR
jgi:hypothetical protein